MFSGWVSERDIYVRTMCLYVPQRWVSGLFIFSKLFCCSLPLMLFQLLAGSRNMCVYDAGSTNNSSFVLYFVSVKYKSNSKSVEQHHHQQQQQQSSDNANISHNMFFAHSDCFVWYQVAQCDSIFSVYLALCMFVSISIWWTRLYLLTGYNCVHWLVSALLSQRRLAKLLNMTWNSRISDENWVGVAFSSSFCCSSAVSNSN